MTAPVVPQGGAAAKIPKPVQRARDKLGWSPGKQLTIYDLLHKLDQSELNKLGSNLRGTLTADAKEQYGKAATDFERRQ